MRKTDFMKCGFGRAVSGVIICLLAFCITFAAPAFADDMPELRSISFNNARLEDSFSSDTFEYTIILDDNSITPTIDSYELHGDAEVFISYSTDYSNRQTGICVELKYSNGSVLYTFNYASIPPVRESSDNTLSAIYCSDCQLEPEMNSSDTSYRLYIPKDMTRLVITPVPNDTNAYCAELELTLNESQEPIIPLVCIATDGTQREYKIKVKRVDKTIEEIRQERANGVEVSLSDGERFYQQPVFLFLCITAAAGIITVIILVETTKRVSAVTRSGTEKSFYKKKEEHE